MSGLESQDSTAPQPNPEASLSLGSRRGGADPAKRAASPAAVGAALTRGSDDGIGSDGALPAEPVAGAERQGLDPLPKPLVELYGLLAVLLVIVPEWMAAALIDNLDPTKGARLTPRSAAWRHDPELVLAELNLMQLRQLARTLGLPTYAADHRERLTRRLLKRLRKGWGHTQIL